MQEPPFVVFAMPRSRSAWLSSFLTYGDWQCAHEELRHVRSLADVQSWLSMPRTGTVETAAAPFWRLLRQFRPDARVLVVMRPAAEVVESFLKLDLRGEGSFDRSQLIRMTRRLEAKLWQIAERWPGARICRFEDLNDEETCREVFEFCLPYAHDHEWFSRVSTVNVQCSMPALMRYERAYRAQLVLANAKAKQAILQGFHRWRSRSRLELAL